MHVNGSPDVLRCSKIHHEVACKLTSRCAVLQQDKIQSPFEIPIISLKGGDGAHILDEFSAASTAKAQIHFDMAVVRSKHPSARKSRGTLSTTQHVCS